MLALCMSIRSALVLIAHLEDFVHIGDIGNVHQRVAIGIPLSQLPIRHKSGVDGGSYESWDVDVFGRVERY